MSEIDTRAGPPQDGDDENMNDQVKWSFPREGILPTATLFLGILAVGIFLFVTRPKGPELTIEGIPLSVTHVTGVTPKGAKADFGYRIVMSEHVVILDEKSLLPEGGKGSAPSLHVLENSEHAANISEEAIEAGLPVSFRGELLPDEEGKPMTFEGKRVLLAKEMTYRKRVYHLE